MSSNKARLKLEFNKSRLTDQMKDPDMWIESLESIRIRFGKMNVTISHNNIIIHIINNLATEYEAVTDQIESDLDDPNVTVDIEYDKNRFDLISII
jgi:hypothetical protein